MPYNQPCVGFIRRQERSGQPERRAEAGRSLLYGMTARRAGEVPPLFSRGRVLPSGKLLYVYL